MTSCVAEMYDERIALLLCHVKLLCETPLAEKFRRSAVDELFRQTDLIPRDRSAADLALLHQILTTFAR